MSNFKEEIEKLRILVNKIRGVKSLREDLITIIETANPSEKNRELITDNSVRWSATYDLITRAVQMKKYIDTLVYIQSSQKNENHLKKINADEWYLYEEICRYLSIFF